MAFKASVFGLAGLSDSFGIDVSKASSGGLSNHSIRSGAQNSRLLSMLMEQGDTSSLMSNSTATDSSRILAFASDVVSLNGSHLVAPVAIRSTSKTTVGPTSSGSNSPNMVATGKEEQHTSPGITNGKPKKSVSSGPKRVLTSYGKKMMAVRAADAEAVCPVSAEQSHLEHLATPTKGQARPAAGATLAGLASPTAVDAQSHHAQETAAMGIAARSPRLSFEFEYDVSGPLEIDGDVEVGHRYSSVVPAGFLVPPVSPFSPSAQLHHYHHTQHQQFEADGVDHHLAAVPESGADDGMSSLASGSTRTLPVGDVLPLGIRVFAGLGHEHVEAAMPSSPTKEKIAAAAVAGRKKTTQVQKANASRGGKPVFGSPAPIRSQRPAAAVAASSPVAAAPVPRKAATPVQNQHGGSRPGSPSITSAAAAPSPQPQPRARVEYRVNALFGKMSVQRVVVVTSPGHAAAAAVATSASRSVKQQQRQYASPSPSKGGVVTARRITMDDAASPSLPVPFRAFDDAHHQQQQQQAVVGGAGVDGAGVEFPLVAKTLTFPVYNDFNASNRSDGSIALSLSSVPGVEDAYAEYKYGQAFASSRAKAAAQALASRSGGAVYDSAGDDNDKENIAPAVYTTTVPSPVMFADHHQNDNMGQEEEEEDAADASADTIQVERMRAEANKENVPPPAAEAEGDDAAAGVAVVGTNINGVVDDNEEVDIDALYDAEYGVGSLSPRDGRSGHQHLTGFLLLAADNNEEVQEAEANVNVDAIEADADAAAMEMQYRFADIDIHGPRDDVESECTASSSLLMEHQELVQQGQQLELELEEVNADDGNGDDDEPQPFTSAAARAGSSRYTPTSFMAASPVKLSRAAKAPAPPSSASFRSPTPTSKTRRATTTTTSSTGHNHRSNPAMPAPPPSSSSSSSPLARAVHERLTRFRPTGKADPVARYSHFQAAHHAAAGVPGSSPGVVGSHPSTHSARKTAGSTTASGSPYKQLAHPVIATTTPAASVTRKHQHQAAHLHSKGSTNKVVLRGGTPGEGTTTPGLPTAASATSAGKTVFSTVVKAPAPAASASSAGMDPVATATRFRMLSASLASTMTPGQPGYADLKRFIMFDGAQDGQQQQGKHRQQYYDVPQKTTAAAFVDIDESTYSYEQQLQQLGGQAEAAAAAAMTAALAQYGPRRQQPMAAASTGGSRRAAW